VATVNVAYAASASITCSLASLASSSTVGRQSTAVDNTSNKYDDAIVTIGVKTSASALANDKTVYVYVAATEDGTNYDSDDAAVGATDAGYTINSPSNLKLAAAIYCPTSSKTYRKVFSVAGTLGGVMPPKWVLVVVNYTGQALDSTEGNHQKTYTGVTYTIA
jgi:hypothetical protein